MGWYNSDGLYVKFGTEEGASATIGENKTFGPQREVEVILDLTTLTSTSAILDYTQFIPSNAFIEAVEIETLTSATSGGSATLSVGLYKSDTTTAISEVAFVSALAVATIGNAGTRLTLTLGSTGVGDKIGTTPAFPGLISAKYGTAAFTAGRVAIRIRYNQGYKTI